MAELEKNKVIQSVPEIRFDGFTDAWEQRKLGEICEQLKDTIDPQLTPDTKYFEYSMPAFDDDSEPDIVSGYEMNSIRKVINAPCLLINKLNVRKRRIWLVESPENNAVCSAEFVPVTSEISSLCFLKYIVMKDDFTAYLEDCSSGSSNSQKRVPPDVIMKATILIPTIAEQIQIGTFFSNLDHLITLHQRKCDTLQKFKKSMLQKMFPQNGESVPEIRFDGFTDAWEQRKLGELIEDGMILEQSDGNHGELYPRNEEFTESGIPYISAANIAIDGESVDFNSTKYLSIERAIKFRKGITKNGDILLAHNATVGPCLRLSMDFDFAVLSTSLTLFRVDESKMDPDYFLQMLRSERFQSQLIKLMKQTTRNQVPILTQRGIGCCFPNNSEEQKKIGNFFKDLDNLITLHQRKLETLQKMKKSLLQKMFV